MRGIVLIACLPLVGCLVDRELYDLRYAELTSDTPADGTWGVRFDADSDCITVDARDVLLDGPFSFDAYVRTDPSPGYALFPLAAWPGAFAVYQDPDGYLVTGPTEDPAAGPNASSPRSLFDGAWHHVAISYGQNGYVSLFLDGARLAFVPVELATAPGDTFYLGCWPEQETAFRGVIGEARLSGAALYDGDFVPEWLPYDPTSATLGLWHLDEGEGTVARDAVDVAPGRITGGTWERFELEGEAP